MTKNQELLKLLEPYRNKTLSFGCELQFKMETPHQVRTTLIEVWAVDMFQTTSGNEHYPKDRFDVIGHPPTLATVLMALEDKDETLLDEDSWNMTIGSYNVAKILRLVDLTQTPDQYSEEVSGALVELLGK